MNKRLSILSLMLGLLVSVALFSACGSDDDDSSNPIVGTWWIEKGGNYTEMTFNSNKTCTWWNYKTDRTTLIRSDKGTYEINGKTLVIWWESEKEYWEESGPWSTTFTIEGNKMITTEGNGNTWTRK